jgi:hypothetical protein
MLLIINDLFLYENGSLIKVELIDKIINYAVKKKFKFMGMIKLNINSSIQPLIMFQKNKN